MKSILGWVSLALVMMAAVSCDKDNMQVDNFTYNDVVYDTIYPKPYFPVYPGSFWIYFSDSNYVTLRVSEQYEQHSYLKDIKNGESVFSDTVYVPVYEGVPSYGYEYIQNIPLPNDPRQVLWPRLSDKVGFEFTQEYLNPFATGDKNEYLTVSEKITSGGDIIDTTLVITGYWKDTAKANQISIREYVYDIGLRKHLVIDTAKNDTIYSSVLVGHKINK